MAEPVLFDVDVLVGRHPRREVGAGTVAELLSAMDRVGIAQALVGHTLSWLHEPATGNKRLLELTADEPRLRPCWVMLPESCGEVGRPEEFATAATIAGVPAIRAYPHDHGYDLAGPDAASMLDAIAATGQLLLVDATQTTWPQLEAVATARPALPVVVCKPGYRSLRRIAGILDRTTNVHIGLSNFSSHCGVEWLAERFGAHRLVFGTGSPEHDPAEAVTRLLYSELDDAAVATIASGQLQRLLGERVSTA